MEGQSCVLVLLVMVAGAVGMIVLTMVAQRGRAAKVKAARASYETALVALRRNPGSAELHQAALAWGRHYSDLHRDSKGRTMFDEVALSNDISAASAGAGHAPAAAATTTAAITDRLDRLGTLRSQGVITEDEYQGRRAKLLEEV